MTSKLLRQLSLFISYILILSLLIFFTARASLIAGAILAIVLIIFSVLLRYIMKIIKIQKNMKYYRILTYEGDFPKSDKIFKLLKNIHSTRRNIFERFFYGDPWFTFLIYRENRRGKSKDSKLGFYLAGDKELMVSVRKHFSNIYPNIEFHEADESHLDFPTKRSYFGYAKLKHNSLKQGYPIEIFQHDNLTKIVSIMEPDTWLQFRFRRNYGFKLRKAIKKTDEDIREQKFKDRDNYEKEIWKETNKRFTYSDVAFDTTISMATNSHDGQHLLKDMYTILNECKSVNELVYRPSMFKVVDWYNLWKRGKSVLTSRELANFVHMPVINRDNSLIDKIKPYTPYIELGNTPLSEDTLATGLKLGTLDHPIIKDREVFILPEILRKQFCVTGATGSGKTNLLNCILNNFNKSFVESSEATPGFSLVDPSGSAIKLLLNRLLVFETFEGNEVDWDKVHFIKVKDSEYPLACNLLAKLDGENSEEMIDNVFRIISENFDTATQAERLLRYTIKALIHDPKETHTIMSVIRMLYKNDDIFRKRIIDRIRPYTEMYEVVNFFDNEASDLIESPSGQAVLNRLDVFKSNSTLRNLFCQKEFNLPIRKWMDEGHIVFYDLVGMSEQEIKIFCSYIAYMYYRVADQRPADTSLLHLTVVDEAHKVQASIFPKIISEQRKFGHSLGIATQNLDDLNSELRSALVNNQSNFFVCRQGESGSALATKIFKSSDRKEQHYTESYFKQLPDNVCALRTQDVIEGETVNVKTQVKVKPIDRVMEDGKVADYKDQYEPKIADEWTMKKAIELSANNGMYYKEIPKMVRAFFEDEEYTYQGKQQEEFKADVIKRKPIVPEELKRKSKKQTQEIKPKTKKLKLNKSKVVLKASKDEVNQEERTEPNEDELVSQETERSNNVGSFLSGFTGKGD